MAPSTEPYSRPEAFKLNERTQSWLSVAKPSSWTLSSTTLTSAVACSHSQGQHKALHAQIPPCFSNIQSHHLTTPCFKQYCFYSQTELASGLFQILQEFPLSSDEIFSLSPLFFHTHIVPHSVHIVFNLNNQSTEKLKPVSVSFLEQVMRTSKYLLKIATVSEKETGLETESLQAFRW